MLFNRRKKTEECNKTEKYVASIILTDAGKSYFPRKTFHVAAKRLGINTEGHDWFTVSEMVNAANEVNLSVAIAIIPFDDVVAIGDGKKRLEVVDVSSSNGSADECTNDGSDNAQKAGN